MSEISSGMVAVITGVGAGVAVVTNFVFKIAESRINGFNAKKNGFDIKRCEAHRKIMTNMEKDIKEMSASLSEHGARLSSIETSLNLLRETVRDKFDGLEKWLRSLGK